MSKIRLDRLMVERGFADNLQKATAIIMTGKVYAGGTRVVSPSDKADSEERIEIRGSHDYVSRGGLKLHSALEFFDVTALGRICIDCGASTGGFTDCLLKKGARLVYAIDVGYGQFAWSLRTDHRVALMERTNIRNVTQEMFPLMPQLAVVDISFISLSLVLPVLRSLLTSDGEAICLIKPQFEAQRDKVGENGIVRDSETHIEVLDAFLCSAKNTGFAAKGLTFSPIKGAKGNVEFFGWISCSGEDRIIDTHSVVLKSHEFFDGGSYGK